MSWLTEFLSEFVYWLTTDEYYRLGFVTGTLFWLSAAILLRVAFVIDFHLKKFRKFFEPTKNPGKMPVELGPSPASMTLGCMGRVLFALIFIVLIILVVWRSFPES